MWLRGKQGEANNVACSYRILGRNRLAFKWWQRGIEAGDDSCFLEIGYCYQHGVGVRKNLEAAARAYESCIAGYHVTEYEREEAMYLLASLILKIGAANYRKKALRLLHEASRDGDYPEAAGLIDQILRDDTSGICTCRRFLRPMLRKQMCSLHRGHRLKSRTRQIPASTATTPSNR